MGSFWSKVNVVEAWHAKLVDRPWLQPLKPTKFVIALIVLSTLIAAGMNWYVRHWQYQVWEQNPEIFYLDDGTPLFTTADAPYFLGLAKAIKEEGDFQQFDQKRLYPVTKDTQDQNPSSSSIFDAPLLSVVLSSVAADFSQKALLEAGNFMIPFTAVLTALMIVFAFGAAGYWLEGSVAAAGAGLSFSYITRSGAGRIDTDQLNLGFFYLITGMVIYAARARSLFSSLALTVLAGAVFWIFDWWYSKPVFGWAFLVGLIWFSAVTNRDLRRIVLQSIMFVIVSGLAFKGLGIGPDSAYLNDTLDSKGLIFPNTFDTITELKRVEFSEILNRISGSVWLGAVSLFGLFFWALRHPALAIVFGPAATFALLNFLIGNRAIFYSAPMLWFGLSWGLLTLAHFVTGQMKTSTLRSGAVLVAMSASFATVWISSPTTYVQSPTFDKPLVQSFKNLNQTVGTNQAVVATWWDYGYMSIFMNQLPTFHDGGSQASPATYFVANNLVIKSQEQAAEYFKLLDKGGSKQIIDMLTGDKQDQPNSRPQNSVYLVLTKDMANWMPSISKIGNWDIVTGKPVQLPGLREGVQMGYETLDCKPSDNPQLPLCNGRPLNLQTGEFGQGVFLDGIVYAKDGIQLEGKKFSRSNSVFIVHSELGERGRRNMLIHRDLYFSVFHQLFHAGRVDQRFFELVYDGYPDIRVFRVK